MSRLNVLLCCGAGMSSGFLAQRARQYAKKNKIDISIEARSESEVGQYANKVDILLVGPHYANALKNLETVMGGTPTVLIPQMIYATLDGEALVKLAIDKIGDKGEK